MNEPKGKDLNDRFALLYAFLNISAVAIERSFATTDINDILEHQLFDWNECVPFRTNLC